MISYQWDAQERMLELKDELVKAGYKVWMDVEKMGTCLSGLANQTILPNFMV